MTTEQRPSPDIIPNWDVRSMPRDAARRLNAAAALRGMTRAQFLAWVSTRLDQLRD